MSRHTDRRGVTILHVSDTQFGRHHRFAEGVHSLAAGLVVDLREAMACCERRRQSQEAAGRPHAGAPSGLCPINIKELVLKS
jgi:hypothetical protein